MEKPLVIVVAVVIILIVAVVIVAVFTQGIQNFTRLFNPWAQAATHQAQCQADCAQRCIGKTQPVQASSLCQGLDPPITRCECGSITGGRSDAGDECNPLTNPCPQGQTCVAVPESTSLRHVCR